MDEPHLRMACKAVFKNGLVFLSPDRRKRDVGAAAVRRPNVRLIVLGKRAASCNRAQTSDIEQMPEICGCSKSDNP